MEHWFDEANTFRSVDLVWSGEAWFCSRQVKHYSAFLQGSTKIKVHSFVLIKAEAEKQSVAYLEDLYEDIKGAKMAQVRWLIHNEDVKQVIPDLDAHCDEYFVTPSLQCIRIKSIGGPAAVLMPSDFKMCLDVLPQWSSSGIYLCHRELSGWKVTPFCLGELPGYDEQGILSLLWQQLDSGNKGKACTRRCRSVRKFNKTGWICSAVAIAPESASLSSGPLLPKSRSNHQILMEPSDSKSSVSDLEDIEFLSQHSGCWFEGKRLQTFKKHVRVQYSDAKDAGNLEEMVPVVRVAPDSLGMRCARRRTVRPRPPQIPGWASLEIGEAVDAWLGSGWWEGVVIGTDSSGTAFEVYFPGEKKFLTVARDVLRPSMDWVDGKWVRIETKRDILTHIFPTRSATT